MKFEQRDMEGPRGRHNYVRAYCKRKSMASLKGAKASHSKFSRNKIQENDGRGSGVGGEKKETVEKGKCKSS